MPGEACAACGQRLGSGLECLPCHDAATRALARQATGVTPGNLPDGVAAVARYLDRRPWWARAAPVRLINRLRLLRMLLHDVLRGQYWLPWDGIATLAAAALYVLSPADLISDFLGPAGFADDGLVVLVAYRLQRHRLLDYCASKGLNPGRFGLEPEQRGITGPDR
jgi:uncharacterized membrane protein YkvA (DUF1232 family)